MYFAPNGGAWLLFAGDAIAGGRALSLLLNCQNKLQELEGKN